MELTEDQLKTAECELKRHLPRSQQVYGFLVLRNRGKANPVKVCVDKWPNFSVIICKPDFEKVPLMCIEEHPYNEAVLEEAIKTPSVIDWEQYFCLGTSLSHMAKVKAVASEKNVPFSQLAVCHMMILQDVTKLPSVDSSGLSLNSLDESHLGLINQTWKFGKNQWSTGMIRNMIVNFPSCCVLDADGKPVSWILTYASCAVGMLHTLPEHRRKGYAKVLISSVAKKLYAEGYPVFCFIEEGNLASYQLFKSMGFTEDPSHRETWWEFNHLNTSTVS
ncbi:glycine-N-acyltransferase-like protein 3 isoform X2 [Kryptolebias marmoratus]|uniref:glycine-N-acyltransferase-like protein 3 isoform X2 n=1 Tax=Kryptolebias marmoratus TaxID=37003 RepID=UPI0007F8F623|nr:glycine-N-acyltransferase-like protein 3 isoform X2 [Kryptolebias marmoratus]